MNIYDNLDLYIKNMDLQENLNNSLFDATNRDVFREKIEYRSLKIHESYIQNSKIIDSLNEYLKNDLPDDEINKLNEYASNMYFSFHHDVDILEPIYLKLIEYYEKKNDAFKVVYNCWCLSYLKNSVQNNSNGSEEYTTKYYEKILSYKNIFNSLETTAKRYLLKSYYNLAGPCLKKIGINESFRLMAEFIDFWENDVTDEDKNNKELEESCYKSNIYLWLSSLSNKAIIARDLFNDENRSFYIKKFDRFVIDYGIDCNKPQDMDVCIFLSYVAVLSLKDYITPYQALDMMTEFYFKKIDNVTEEYLKTMSGMHLTSVMANIIIELLQKLYKGKEAYKRFKIIDVKTRQMWDGTYGDGAHNAYLDSQICSWCKSSLPFLTDENEKNDTIFNIILRGQLQTYLHSYMVMKISLMILEEAYKANESLFANLDMNYFDLYVYIKAASLLHDIGKTKIKNVINLEARRLDDDEFAAIKNHPKFGFDIAEDDQALSKYADVIIGHHKYYDGKGGYPIDFDNTKSPYRIIIDLITIADSLDAATDYLGRNYKKAKEFDEVLAELNATAGTRYNPYLVEIINNSEALKLKLRTITKDQRLDYMYDAYMDKILR